MRASGRDHSPFCAQGANFDRVYEIYVVTFWLRSAQLNDPECEAGWEHYGGSRKYPRVENYVNSADLLCAWYEAPPNGDSEDGL